MKLKSALGLFAILGVIGWALSARAQDSDGSDAGGLNTNTLELDGAEESFGDISSSGTTTFNSGTTSMLSMLGSVTTNPSLYSGSVNSTTGTLVLSANSYSGSTIVNGGTLKLGNVNIYSVANTTINSGTFNTGSLTLSGGLTSLSTGSTLTVGSLNVSSGTINLAIGANLSGAITGSTTAIFNTGTLNVGGTSIITGALTLPTNNQIIYGLENTLPDPTLVFPSPFIGTLYIPPASSYQATDLGNLSDWLANESGEPSTVINSLLSSGMSSHVTFPLPGFVAISPSLQNLGSLSNALDSSGTGWTLTQEYGFNTAGDVVVGATASDGTSHALLLAPVPEPAGGVLAGCGLAALLFARRRARLAARG